jgi:DNA-nicking Smr family endonuclease
MDLHGFPAAVAKSAIDFVLQEMKDNKHTYNLEIITGRGNHVNSGGTKGVLKLVIEKYLKSLQPPDVIEIITFPDNDGCVIVSKESLEAWFMKIDFILSESIL